MHTYQKRSLFAVLFVMISGIAMAQVYSNKPVGKKNESLVDSLKSAPYPYVLPIWGEKVAKKGFLLPYSAGIGINYLWQESELVINNLMVGFNNGPQVNLDNVVRIDQASATAYGLNFRPDVWLLPFLNVYGVFAKAKTSTAIGAGIYIPDTNNNWNEVSRFSTKADFDATSFGFGITPTVGVAGGWLALDMNMVWTDVSALDKPVFTFVFGPRMGKTFKLKKPEQTIAFWAGGFRVKFSSETSGNIALNEVMQTDEWESKIANGYAKVEAAQTNLNNWWSGLTPAEQANPLNAKKYETGTKAIETTTEFLVNAEGAVSTAESSTVQYSLDKDLKNMWNFVVGSQFQLNRHWMVRAEYGFLGTRNQFLTGLQYRFGL